MEARALLDILDLTLLDKGASEGELEELCIKANEYRPAAVCVFKKHIRFVKSRLNDEIPISALVGGFPIGSESPQEIANEILDAINSGAQEIDCVLEPSDEDVFPSQREMSKLIAMREASSGYLLKVIVEAPILDERKLRGVIRMALASGADFVKSCTGRRGGCSEEAADIMAFEVRRHCQTMGGSAGLKISGGVSSKADAERLISRVLDQDPSISGSARIRLGSSSLMGELLESGGLGRN